MPFQPDFVQLKSQLLAKLTPPSKHVVISQPPLSSSQEFVLPNKPAPSSLARPHAKLPVPGLRTTAERPRKLKSALKKENDENKVNRLETTKKNDGENQEKSTVEAKKVVNERERKTKKEREFDEEMKMLRKNDEKLSRTFWMNVVKQLKQPPKPSQRREHPKTTVLQNKKLPLSKSEINTPHEKIHSNEFREMGNDKTAVSHAIEDLRLSHNDGEETDDKNLENVDYGHERKLTTQEVAQPIMPPEHEHVLNHVIQTITTIQESEEAIELRWFSSPSPTETEPQQENSEQDEHLIETPNLIEVSVPESATKFRHDNLLDFSRALKISPQVRLHIRRTRPDGVVFNHRTVDQPYYWWVSTLDKLVEELIDVAISDVAGETSAALSDLVETLFRSELSVS